MTPFLHSLKLVLHPLRPNKDKMRTQAISLALAVVLLGPLVSAQWVHTNGPYGGYISCMAVFGTNLFAGTGHGFTNGAVFLSTNNGTSWSAVNIGLVVYGPGQTYPD